MIIRYRLIYSDVELECDGKIISLIVFQNYFLGIPLY